MEILPLTHLPHPARILSDCMTNTHIYRLKVDEDDGDKKAQAMALEAEIWDQPGASETEAGDFKSDKCEPSGATNDLAEHSFE